MVDRHGYIVIPERKIDCELSPEGDNDGAIKETWRVYSISLADGLTLSHWETLQQGGSAARRSRLLLLMTAHYAL